MPEGSYLDAGKLGPSGLAKEMNDIINNPGRFYDFFRWQKYYTFHNSVDDDYNAAVCGFCALLNNNTRRNQRAYYRNMTRWWNEWGQNRVYPTTVQVDPPAPEESNIVDNVKDAINKLYDYFFPETKK